MQVILPEGASPPITSRSFAHRPSVEDAWVAPDVSLPKAL